MTFIFPALLLVVFLACLGSLYTEGLWSNALRLVNVLTAALVAVNFWEPVARQMEGSLPSFTFMCDIAALWGVFGLTLLAFRTAARNVSAVKVRFTRIADQVGSLVCAALVGWVMVCFTTMSLHTAPLGERFLWRGFNHEKRMLLGLAPDRQFLGFVSFVSRGSLSRFQTRPFDPNKEFIQTYAKRRAAFELHMEQNKSFQVGPSGRKQKR
jgi:hypothetical protein